MISKKLETRASLFVSELKTMSRIEKIKACRVERNELIKEYAATYVRSIFTVYRANIGKEVNYLKPLFKVSKGVQSTIEKKYKKEVVKRQKELVEIRNFKGLIDKAKELLNSNKVVDISLALIVLTGRRSTEILKTAKFTNWGKSTKMLAFNGQLKKKGKNERFKLYTLGDSSKICKVALKTLREKADTKNMTNDDVARRYKPQLFMKCNFLFSEYLGRCSPHDLRKAYIAIAVGLYKPKNQSVNSFSSELLGHSEDDINTANSYQKYYI